MSKLSKNITNAFEELLSKSMYEPNKNLTILKKILRDTGSIIAGGSVLSVCTTHKHGLYKINDFDFYTPVLKARPLLEFIFGKRSSYKMLQRCKSSTYCQNFLSKNNIRCIYENSYTSPVFISEVDVMTIRNKSDPIQVVKNFDLTFCQVWYDGEYVYANHPDDVFNRTGKINDNYIIPFLNGNAYLEARYDKYIRRGFKIEFEYPHEHILEDDIQFYPKKFKKMTKEEVEMNFPDDASKKRLVMKILFKIMTNKKKDFDESCYDSEDIDEDDFSHDEYSDASKKFFESINKSVYAAGKPNSKLLVDWMKKYTNF